MTLKVIEFKIKTLRVPAHVVLMRYVIPVQNLMFGSLSQKNYSFYLLFDWRFLLHRHHLCKLWIVMNKNANIRWGGSGSKLQNGLNKCCMLWPIYFEIDSVYDRSWGRLMSIIIIAAFSIWPTWQPFWILFLLNKFWMLWLITLKLTIYHLYELTHIWVRSWRW